VEAVDSGEEEREVEVMVAVGSGAEEATVAAAH
jgi:hypothetical protein